ncbi:MAG TPA: hypothetical protein VK658_19490 [Chryseolinea sp.]|nr:hypothetical protein [Chryseolinea sp.]
MMDFKNFQSLHAPSYASPSKYAPTISDAYRQSIVRRAAVEDLHAVLLDCLGALERPAME